MWFVSNPERQVAMKKWIFAVIFSVAALLVSCKADDNNGDEDSIILTPPPPGVYIAGSAVNQDGVSQACYWIGNDRVFLDGNILGFISVSDGTVLVIGASHNGKTYYWIDGVRYELTNYPNRKVIISGGKVYKFDGISSRSLWVDGVEMRRYSDSNNFEAYDIAVFNGVIYIAGAFKPSPGTGYVAGYLIYDRSWGEFWLWENITDNSEFTFVPRAITVGKDGAVYIAGTDPEISFRHSKGWYYTGGNFYELEGFDGNNRINKIVVDNGKLYVFDGPSNGKPYEYWVDGKKVAAVGTENYTVYDAAVSDGTVYMTGFHSVLLSDDTITSAAFYWVDGERFNLGISAEALAIYVEE